MKLLDELENRLKELKDLALYKDRCIIQSSDLEPGDLVGLRDGVYYKLADPDPSCFVGVVVDKKGDLVTVETDSGGFKMTITT